MPTKRWRQNCHHAYAYNKLLQLHYYSLKCYRCHIYINLLSETGSVHIRWPPSIPQHCFNFSFNDSKDDYDADAKMIPTTPPPENWKRPPARSRITWLNTASATWEPATSRWTKQSTWTRTDLCGGWCLYMVLNTPSGAWQKKRSSVIQCCWIGDRIGTWPVKILLQKSHWFAFWDIQLNLH